MQSNKPISEEKSERFTKRAVALDAIALLVGFICYIAPVFTGQYTWIYVACPWLYLFCFLFYTRRIQKKRQWIVFALVFCTANEIRYFDLLGTSLFYVKIASVLAVVIASGVLLLPFLGDAIYGKKVKGMSAIFAFPLIRIVTENLLTLSGLGSQFNLSISQFDNKWLIQGAAMFGESFVGIIVALVPSALIYLILLLQKRQSIKKRDSQNKKTPEYKYYAHSRNAAIIVLLLCAMVANCGSIRYYIGLHRAKRFPNLTMAYVPGPQSSFTETPGEDLSFEENIAFMQRTVREAADGEACLIAYPEEAFQIEGNEDRQKFIDAACKAAMDNDIYILLCIDLDLGEDERSKNEAIFIGVEGEVYSEYAKSNLIPIIESSGYEPGDGEMPLEYFEVEGEELVISYTICYDTTSTYYVQTCDSDVNLYISPSWDWPSILDINWRLQGTRAVENGMTIFKPTMDGYTIVTDAYGNVSYMHDSTGKDYDKVFFVEIPPSDQKVLYHYFAPFINIFWFAALIGIIIKYVLARRAARTLMYM